MKLIGKIPVPGASGAPGNMRNSNLDVAFREDDHRLREGHAPENMSLVRKIALAMLKKSNEKVGIKNRRLKAGWDDNFLEHVLRDFLEN